MELHMARARDRCGSDHGSRKQSCACLWSEGAMRREGHVLPKALCVAILSGHTASSCSTLPVQMHCVLELR